MGAVDLDALHAAVQTLGRGLPDPARVGAGAPGGRHGRVSDLLRVCYRLIFAASARARGAALTLEDACAGLELSTVPAGLLDLARLDAAAGKLAGEGGGAGVASGLGALHEAFLSTGPVWREDRLLLDGDARPRKAGGSWFTPARLVEHLLDEALEPCLDETEDPIAVTVCDPSCGAGAFLVAAARRLARRLAAADPPRSRRSEREALFLAVTRCVHGVDLDPAAVELARVALWLELVEPGAPVAMPTLRLRAGDALLGVDWPTSFPAAYATGGFDVVVGNPPFLNRLERLTAPPAPTAARLHDAAGGTLRPYTDLSAVFLQRAVSWVRPGGRVALVQPQSLLAARDAAGVREHVAANASLESLWASDRPLFEASVLTCAPVLRRGGSQAPVRRTHGPSFEPVAAREVTADELRGEWAFLVAAGLGTPELRLDHRAGAVGDIAACTADFRDQYYGLRPYLREAATCTGCRCVPLVTTGLIDPAELRWGRVPTRVLKQRWAAPAVDLDALEAEPRLARWAQSRLVPKVLVGTQGRVVEAVADPDGRLLPSVPTVTVTAIPERLWHVLAVLLAPPVTAYAAVRYAGTGLTMRSVKLSARQVAALPLPSDHVSWGEAATLLPAAQRDDNSRARLLAEAGVLMCRAYGVDDPDVLRWWQERAGLTPR